jgi:hypothetical protein
MGGNGRMTANKKIVGLCSFVAAGALAAGCTTEVTTPDLEAGRYDVMGLELGGCADSAPLVQSSTPMRSIVVDAIGDGFVFSACTDSGCALTSPSQYTWRDDKWVAETGGAYLVDTGCLLLHVSATARIENGELVVETTRWTNELTSGACTIAEVTAMFERPCDVRSRVLAVEAIAH